MSPLALALAFCVRGCLFSLVVGPRLAAAALSARRFRLFKLYVGLGEGLAARPSASESVRGSLTYGLELGRGGYPWSSECVRGSSARGQVSVPGR